MESGATPGRTAKHKSLRDKRAQGCRGHHLGPRKKTFHKKRAEVAEVGEDEGDFIDPEGDTDEEAWTSETSDSHDEEEADQGNA